MRARPACETRRSPPRLFVLTTAAASAFVLAFAANSAAAQNYPWCSNFADGAGTNCGFTSEEQCRLAVRGSGGYCDRNPQYRASSAATDAKTKARRRSPRS